MHPFFFPFFLWFIVSWFLSSLLTFSQWGRGVEVMVEVFFHARLVLTVCVSSSRLHYVTWTELFFFPPHSHGLCFSPSGSLSFSYVNNFCDCKVMRKALQAKEYTMFELSHTGLCRMGMNKLWNEHFVLNNELYQSFLARSLAWLWPDLTSSPTQPLPS